MSATAPDDSIPSTAELERELAQEGGTVTRGTGMTVGAATGAAIGGAIGALASGGVAAVIGANVGAAAGAAVGSVIASERGPGGDITDMSSLDHSSSSGTRDPVDPDVSECEAEKKEQ